MSAFAHACIILPYPPSTNNLFSGKARRFISKGYQSWIDEASHALRQQRPLPHHTEAVRLDMTVGRPRNKDGTLTARKRDLSNCIKAPEDLLVKFGVMEDDSQVQEINIRWDSSGDITGIQIEIYPIEPKFYRVTDNTKSPIILREHRGKTNV